MTRHAPGTEPVRLIALGVRLSLHVEDPSLLPLLHHLLQDLAPRDPDEGRTTDAVVLVSGTGPWLVSSPGHSRATASVAEVTSAVLAAVNLTAVQSTRLLAVHAAVLARQDRVLVVPAASGTGKSTLTACLLARGWSYVSDEALCLRWEDGALLPYPRPVALSEWSADVAGVRGAPGHDGAAVERVVAASAEGWGLARPSSPVTDVVLLSRRDGPASLVEVARQEAVVELLRRSFTHFLDPARALGLLSTLAAGARCRRLLLGDPRAAAALLDPPDAAEARPLGDAPPTSR